MEQVLGLSQACKEGALLAAPSSGKGIVRAPNHTVDICHQVTLGISGQLFPKAGAPDGVWEVIQSLLEPPL
jgi:hypothetical protein